MTQRTKILIKIAITACLLGFLLWKMDLRVFWDVLVSAKWQLVILAGALHFATVFFSVSRWKVIVRNFSIGLSYFTLMKLCLIGYFFNMFLPSAIGGDFFRAYYLAKSENRGMSTTLTTTVLDRIAGLSALLMIGLGATLIYPVRVEGYLVTPLFLLLSLGFSVAIAILFHQGMHRKVNGLLERFHLEDLEAKIELVTEGLNQLRRNRAAILSVVGLSLCIQFIVIVVMWVAALSINIDAPFYLFLVFIPIVNLSVAFPVTINGVGLRESVYFLLFSQIGVPVETAVTLSVLNMVVVMMTAIPGGVVYSLYKKEESFDLTDVDRGTI